jgi:hypothetical protein
MDNKRLSSLAQRDSKRIRDNRKQAPCTLYDATSEVVKAYQAMLDREAEAKAAVVLP